MFQLFYKINARLWAKLLANQTFVGYLDNFVIGRNFMKVLQKSSVLIIFRRSMIKSAVLFRFFIPQERK